MPGMVLGAGAQQEPAAPWRPVSWPFQSSVMHVALNHRDVKEKIPQMQVLLYIQGLGAQGVQEALGVP